MAYTYDDFIKAADSAGLTQAFSEQDLQAAQKNPEFGISLLSLMKDSNNATTAEQRLLATEAANQLRKNYGIYNTGVLGADGTYASSYGSKITGTMDAIDGYGSFQYANQEGYQKLLDSVANPEPFSYDPESDPSYNAYAKAYLREGERASANALAQAAAATGGRPSSYAISAAQQAANYYAAQLADALPTLEQNAYSRYLSDFNNRVTALNAMSTDKQFDYSDWLQQYNMLQNSLQNYQNQDATDYQRYLNAWEQDYQIGQDELSKLIELITTTGYKPSESELAAAGMSREQADAYLTVYNNSSGTGSSSGTGTVTGYQYDTHGYTTEQIKEMQLAAGIAVDGIWGPDTQAAYENGFRPDGDNTGEIDLTLYDDWTVSEWVDYFSALADEDPAGAEYDLKELGEQGIIPAQLMPLIYANAISGKK